MSVLARNAEQLFWLARYIERAGSLARIIETHSSYGRASADDLSWGWLVALYSNQERFGKDYAETTFKNVIRFYVSDVANPGSIQFSVRAARENARALRAVIPTEMWNQLNGFYQRLSALGDTDFDLVGLSRTCGIIKDGCYAQLGVVDSTLYRDEGERFFRLGLMVERADQTSRLLDVKFAQLATSGENSGAIADTTFWSLILRSAAAYQAFRRQEPHGADPSRVARFLLVNGSQPRSVDLLRPRNPAGPARVAIRVSTPPDAPLFGAGRDPAGRIANRGTRSRSRQPAACRQRLAAAALDRTDVRAGRDILQSGTSGQAGSIAVAVRLSNAIDKSIADAVPSAIQVTKLVLTFATTKHARRRFEKS